MSIIVYALGSGRYPAIFDSSGADVTTNKKFWPAAHFGKIDTLAVRPVKDNFTPYTKAELDEFVSFDFGIDNDWDTDTPPKIRTTSGFSVQEVTEVMIEADPDNGIAEESITWAQIVFLVDYGTDEIKTLIQGKSDIELGAELDGLREGEVKPGLIINFPHLLLGRRLENGTGTPNPVGDGTYSSAQIDALLSASKNNNVPADTATAFELGRLDAGRGFNVTAMFTDEVSGNDEGASLDMQVFLSQGAAKLTNKNGFSEIANLNIISGISASITGTAPDEVVNLVITTTAGNALKMNFKSTSI